MKIAGCQPDSGNPTVRDERGACGNVNYGGIRNPLHSPKGCMSETLRLRLRAPYFYPTTRACAQRGSLETGPPARRAYASERRSGCVLARKGKVSGADSEE